MQYMDELIDRCEFLDAYAPNVTSLLPPSLAETLHRTARWENGPHHFEGAVTLRTEFLTEFCWSSSKLEGCRFTLSETASLLKLEEQLQTEAAHRSEEARIVVNHKRALELMVFDTHPDRVSVHLLQRLQGRPPWRSISSNGCIEGRCRNTRGC